MMIRGNFSDEQTDFYHQEAGTIDVAPKLPRQIAPSRGTPVERYPGLSFDGAGKPGLFYIVIKRALDFVLAGMLLILLLPIFTIIACFIKFDSKGSVLFRQQRIGKNRRYHSNGHLIDRRNGNLQGKPFNIYKFRTMKQGVASYAISPREDHDSRVTRIGRFLRSTCLDEMPQLINVLKGDMSLVGPRPEMPFIVKKYNELESLRLAVKPGLTGLWQLYGTRELPIHKNLKYDLDYIKNRSLKLDFKIMLKTVLFMLRFKNV